MSEAPALDALLSREELGALLESMAESARNEQVRQTRRPVGLMPTTGVRSELVRIASVFAEEQGRGLSTLFQSAIGFELTQWEEISLRDFGAAMMSEDRVARVHLGNGQADAYIQLNRPFLFDWMMLAFGAKPRSGEPQVPDRPYTRIEERFMQRAAGELAATLASSLPDSIAGEVRVSGLEPPSALLDRASRAHLVASFDVSGLGDLGRLRIALPSGIVESGSVEKRRDLLSAPSRPVQLQDELLEVAVDVHVEIGRAKLSLSEVADLHPGTEIPLQTSGAGDLLIRVGDQPKFRAERGSLDKKLAVRVLEEL